jgi:hypothetical protein
MLHCMRRENQTAIKQEPQGEVWAAALSLVCCPSIGPTARIFPLAVLLLVQRREYSLLLSFYGFNGESIPFCCPSIGHPARQSSIAVRRASSET